VIPPPANGHLPLFGEEGGTPSLRDVVCVVAIVMADALTVAPSSVTFDGEKLHVELVGSPEQEKDTA
jgi:hypothetical protein